MRARTARGLVVRSSMPSSASARRTTANWSDES